VEKSQFDNYIDGVAIICKENAGKTDFEAKINVKKKPDLERIVKLNYGLMSKRNEDLEFAEQMGFTLTKKIKVRMYKGITSKHLVAIENYLYSIKHIDMDKKNMYLYLEGVRELAE